jgi:hypothetical protein
MRVLSASAAAIARSKVMYMCACVAVQVHYCSALQCVRMAVCASAMLYSGGADSGATVQCLACVFMIKWERECVYVMCEVQMRVLVEMQPCNLCARARGPAAPWPPAIRYVPRAQTPAARPPLAAPPKLGIQGRF